jgi:hypothetical protein
MATTQYSSSDMDTVLYRIGKNRDNQLQQFQTQVLNNYQTLFDKVNKENIKIAATYNLSNNNNSVNSQKSKYLNQSNQILQKIYTYLFWIYLVLAVVLVGVLFVFSNVSIYLKGGLSLVFLLFPFYIYFLETFFYSVFDYAYSLLSSSVYSSNYSNLTPEKRT